jgi:sec-independent protein translocase protein TatA
MSIGPEKILVILVVALLVFGPQRLPEIGRQVGTAVRELRKMQSAVRGELDMVLHPEHGTRSSEVRAEPGDHAAISSEDITSVEATSDAFDDERRFLGPPDSFS